MDTVSARRKTNNRSFSESICRKNMQASQQGNRNNPCFLCKNNTLRFNCKNVGILFHCAFYFPSFTIEFFPTCTWFDQQSAGLWGVSLCLSYTSPPEMVASCTIVLSLVIKASLWHPLLDSVKNWIKWNQFNKYPFPSAYCIEGAAGLGGDTWREERERHRLQEAYSLFQGLRHA